MVTYTEPKLKVPNFEQELVADQLNDGYWLESPDIDQDGKPDLFGHGIGIGEIYWYHNPDWTRRLLADKFHMPIGAHYADITGNGYPDAVVCYELYGPGGRIDDPDPKGGKIDWMENPGDQVHRDGRWKRHYIGRTTAMHRLRVGHFTRTDRLEVMGVPCVGATDVHGLIPVTLFTQPDNVQDADEWPRTVVDDLHFRMIHGAEKKENLIPGSDLDSMLLASEEGITWLYFDEKKRKWNRILIGTGELSQYEETTYKGSGDVNVGRIGDDPFAYVAATEPFHGNTVAVYLKDKDGPQSPAQARWRRVVLDVYGDPNELGEGPGHQVVCADFDGDGDDEFLVALRGPWPWQGVMYYKALDLENGIFTKWRVSSESTARIAVADFDGTGSLDFATIAYKVEKYYVAKEAKLLVFHNRMLGGNHSSESPSTIPE